MHNPRNTNSFTNFDDTLVFQLCNFVVSSKEPKHPVNVTEETPIMATATHLVKLFFIASCF